jgi:hypothetical protein
MHLRLRHAVAVTAVVLPLALAGPTAAQAAPTNCAKGPTGDRGSYAVCTGGTGSYRAFIQCRGYVWPHNYYINYGSWQVPSNPVWSVASCNWPDSRQLYGVDLS